MKEDEDYIHTEEPQEHVKGWWFPISLVRLYEKGIIGAADMMLLGRVHILCHPKKGCFASNEYLAKYGNRSKRQVSRALAHLEELGLVSITVKRIEGQGTKRTIWTTFEGGWTKRVGGTTQKGSSVVLNNNNPPRSAGGMGLGDGKVFEACKALRLLTKERTGKRYTDHILRQRWQTVAESFIQEQLKGNQGHFLEVLDWYMQNIDGEYMPELGSIPRFCERFRQIEKARARHRQSGTDPESPWVQTIIHKPVIVKGTKSDPKDTW